MLETSSHSGWQAASHRHNSASLRCYGLRLAKCTQGSGSPAASAKVPAAPCCSGVSELELGKLLDQIQVASASASEPY